MNQTFNFLLFLFLSFFSLETYAQITLPYHEDFEGADSIETSSNLATITGLTGWEFETSTAQGRIRTQAGTGYPNSGTKAITLDAILNGANPEPINYLIGHWDLSNYDANADAIGLSFAWMDHGDEPDVNDRVWIRGSNTDTWIEILNWSSISVPNGTYQFVEKMNISTILLNAGQNYSSTFEIRFGQEDNFMSSTPNGSDGFTVDDVKLEKIVPYNIGVVAILSPSGITCGDSMTSVTVVMENCGANTIVGANVTINMTGDLAGTVSGTNSDSVAFGQLDTFTIDFLNTYAGGTVTLTAFTTLTTDSIPENDTASITLTFTGITNPTVTGASICSLGDSTTLIATPISGFVHTWFDSAFGGNILAKGDNYPTGPIATNTTFYVNAAQVVTTNVGHLGPNTNSTNPNTLNFYQNFTALGEFTIDSMTLYPNDTGLVSIRITDPTGAIVYDSISVLVEPNAAFDPVRIPVGITIAPGDYRMNSFGSTVGALGYSNGAAFPYSATNIVDITGSSNGGIYFFFYDWKITGLLCPSARIPVPVTVGNAPSINLGTNINQCGGVVTLDAANSGSNYNWSNGDTTQTTVISTSGIYTVMVTDSNNCSATDTIDIEIHSNPIVMLGADIIECDHSTVTLDAGNLGSSYNWSNGDTTQTTVVNTSGMYIATVIDTNSCVGMDTIEVSISDLVASAVDNGNGTATATGSGGVTTTTYTFLWSNGDTTATATGLAAGVAYCVTITDDNGCSDSACISINLGLNSLEMEENIQVYPNPTLGNAFAKFSFAETTDLTIEIIDITGRSQEKISLHATQEAVIKLPTDALPSGTYFVRFQVGNEISTQKLTIQNR
ncbi:T9SS type A sorting domain-containing protein [Aureispira sp. CCB-E]|uniref:T9SS type A sorting domain-containing protein n=1 Tax=Aureispira sp. CCB-E TaxID=3051121 RepID=UPI0028695259|nr:T9SS type A sorting domain-containing protein [Aureispira sp. CCB-E]WMX12658.1 T9SS type A sorting domain-containing protein [Aureispira sp. CCB-E]